MKKPSVRQSESQQHPALVDAARTYHETGETKSNPASIWRVPLISISDWFLPQPFCKSG